jgi:hypothetical protein
MTTVVDRNIARRKVFLHGIDPATMTGMEIGALNRPTVSKSDGEILYADFTDTEQLKKLYEAIPSVNVDDLVDVDLVWRGEALSNILEGKRLDYAIASHVIEHIPNPISWLQQISNNMRDDGILSLIVPDKRFTFDRLRPLTMVRDWISTFIERADKPRPAQIFEHIAYHSLVDPAIAWASPEGNLEFPRIHNEKDGFDLASQVWVSGAYHDVHCWAFTPRSILDILDGVSRAGLLDFYVLSITDSCQDEIDFFLSLKKINSDIDQNTRKEIISASIKKAKETINVGKT